MVTNPHASATLMRTPTVRLTVCRALLSGCIGLGGLALAACSDASRGVAQGILRHTVPPGDTVPSLSEPVRADQSLQFTWDFETHLSTMAYADWLKAQLRDFQVIAESESDLRFGQSVGGDAYRLRVTLQAATAMTQVHVQLVASPD
jgi:hypothetical protein